MRNYSAISKRLRRYSENCVAYKLDADFANAVTDAADAIEELLAEMVTLRNQLPQQTVETNLYDQEEIHHNCTVQILRNSITGEVSVGWWENEDDDSGN